MVDTSTPWVLSTVSLLIPYGTDQLQILGVFLFIKVIIKISYHLEVEKSNTVQYHAQLLYLARSFDHSNISIAQLHSKIRKFILNQTGKI